MAALRHRPVRAVIERENVPDQHLRRDGPCLLVRQIEKCPICLRLRLFVHSPSSDVNELSIPATFLISKAGIISATPNSKQEVEWILANREAYRGRWVAVSGGKFWRMKTANVRGEREGKEAPERCAHVFTELELHLCYN